MIEKVKNLSFHPLRDFHEIDKLICGIGVMDEFLHSSRLRESLIANHCDSYIVEDDINCNVEFAFLRSEKKFSKNSSLVTRNAVNGWDIEAYSVNSPYTTRHPTHHQNRCILLRV